MAEALTETVVQLVQKKFNAGQTRVSGAVPVPNNDEETGKKAIDLLRRNNLMSELTWGHPGSCRCPREVIRGCTLYVCSNPFWSMESSEPLFGN